MRRKQRRTPAGPQCPGRVMPTAAVQRLLNMGLNFLLVQETRVGNSVVRNKLTGAPVKKGQHVSF